MSRSDIFRPQLVVDGAGSITVLHRVIAGSSYELRAERYTDAGGWPAPRVLRAGSDFFRTFGAVADAQGNLIGWLDPYGSGGAALQSIRYVAASDSWTAPQPPASGLNERLPALAVLTASPDRNRALRVYTRLAAAGMGAGIVVHRYSAASGPWGAAEPPSNTAPAVPRNGYACVSPMVDGAGNVLVGLVRHDPAAQSGMLAGLRRPVGGAWLGDSGRARLLYLTPGGLASVLNDDGGAGWVPVRFDPPGTSPTDVQLTATPGGQGLAGCTDPGRGAAGRWLSP